MRKNELDEVDKKIIENLLRGKTQSEIAEMIGVTLRTVQNRIKALEDQGYLIKLKEGYWVANYQKIGLNMLAVILIDLDVDSKNRIDEIIEHFKKLDFVENIFEIVGSQFDLCMIVRYKDVEEYRRERRKFMDWMSKKGIKINHLHTYLASRTHKDHRRTMIP
ncbi:MAG: transcriptional regulator [Archaeoglobi archaeon]|jgi:DNA-binding Lrp family transcriptional regulator|nr:MAG: transcriptional regulator [Archaeoglobi archaeon]TDA28479.1 MAG: transcriptional regulator [Archaeoglobi archaeon]